MKMLSLVLLATTFSLFGQDPSLPLAPQLALLSARHNAGLMGIDAGRKSTVALAQQEYANALQLANRTAAVDPAKPDSAAIQKELIQVKTVAILPPDYPAGLPESLLARRQAYLDAIAAARVKKIDGDYLAALGALESTAPADPALLRQIAVEKTAIFAKATPAASETPALGGDEPATPPGHK